MYDLLYFSKEQDRDIAMKLIGTKFPEAKLSIKSKNGFVRLEVILSDKLREEYKKFLFQENLDSNSFIITKLRLNGKIRDGKI